MSVRFEFVETSFTGLYTVIRKPINDGRGFFSRFFCAEEFKAIGLTKPIVQMNQSLTDQQGTVRGLHFQHPPFAEEKIVSCIRGAVIDIVVDIRKGSNTFLQWHGETLSADNHKSLFIPKGFAHGFQTLTENCELIYLHTESYQPAAEGALNPTDPALAINWPLAISHMSDRDQSHALLDANFQGVI